MSEISYVAPVGTEIIHYQVFSSLQWYAGAISTPKQYYFLDYAAEAKTKQGRCSSNSGYKIHLQKYVTGKYTRSRAPLVRKYTNRIFESKDGTTSMTRLFFK